MSRILALDFDQRFNTFFRFVSLSHLFGAVVVMKHSAGTFELHCKKASSTSSDGVGGTIMLSDTFAVTSASKVLKREKKKKKTHSMFLCLL